MKKKESKAATKRSDSEEKRGGRDMVFPTPAEAHGNVQNLDCEENSDCGEEDGTFDAKDMPRLADLQAQRQQVDEHDSEDWVYKASWEETQEELQMQRDERREAAKSSPLNMGLFPLDPKQMSQSCSCETTCRKAGMAAAEIGESDGSPVGSTYGSPQRTEDDRCHGAINTQDATRQPDQSKPTSSSQSNSGLDFWTSKEGQAELKKKADAAANPPAKCKPGRWR